MFYGPTPVKQQTYVQEGMNAIVTPKCAYLPAICTADISRCGRRKVIWTHLIWLLQDVCLLGFPFITAMHRLAQILPAEG
jgi:hypothetical protein